MLNFVFLIKWRLYIFLLCTGNFFLSLFKGIQTCGCLSEDSKKKDLMMNTYVILMFWLMIRGLSEVFSERCTCEIHYFDSPWVYSYVWIQLYCQIFCQWYLKRSHKLSYVTKLSCKFPTLQIWTWNSQIFQDLTWMFLEVQFTKRAALQKLVCHFIVFKSFWSIGWEIRS